MAEKMKIVNVLNVVRTIWSLFSKIGFIRYLCKLIINVKGTTIPATKTWKYTNESILEDEWKDWFE